MVSNKIYLLLDLNRLPKCSIIPHPPMKMTPHFCIMLFGLRTRKENIRDYAELYTKDPFLALSFALCFLSLRGLPPLAGFFRKFHLFWCGW